MNWLDAVFLSVVVFATTLALVHVPVWFRDRQARANAALGFLALSVALLALAEWRVLAAQTPLQYGDALWRQQFVALAALCGVVWCFRTVLRAGNLWLGSAAVGLRALFTLINAVSTPNGNFREISALETVVVEGVALPIPVGTPNPAMIIGQAALLLAIVFVVHATWQLLKRRERLAAVVVGLSFMLAISAGTALGALAYWGVIRTPVLVSPNFLPGLVILAWWLSADLLAGRESGRRLREQDHRLREYEQRLALASSAVDAGLWGVDIATGKVWGTPRTMTMFGLPATPSLSVADFLSRVHPEDRERVSHEVDAACTEEVDRRFGFRATDDAERERWYSVTCRRVVADDDAGSSGATLIGMTIDVTDLKHAEAQALRARDEARSASAAKSTFLAQMSHEIRTPLHAILGHTDLLRRSGPSSGQSESIATIEVACRHLLSVIEDVLDMARIESGKLGLARSEFSLHALVRGVAELIGPEAAAKGLSLTVDLGDVPDRVIGDPARLRQGILNYAVNALKFTSRGAITIACATQAVGDDGCLLRFEVRDTGPGVSATDAARLFTAFARLDDPRSRAQGGTGLGLAITREIARLMGGEAGVEGSPGAGSTFWLTAMLRPAASLGLDAARSGRDAEAAEAEQGIRDRYHGARVLLVEDNRVSRRLAQRLLGGAGLDVTPAASGEEALELAAGATFDLVLMDLNMPGMDGIETTRRLRTMPGWAEVPIVAVTGQAFESDRDACLAAGMTGFVTKPVEWPSFWPRLLGWLDAARPRHPTAAGSV